MVAFQLTQIWHEIEMWTISFHKQILKGTFMHVTSCLLFFLSAGQWGQHHDKSARRREAVGWIVLQSVSLSSHLACWFLSLFAHLETCWWSWKFPGLKCVAVLPCRCNITSWSHQCHQSPRYISFLHVLTLAHRHFFVSPVPWSAKNSYFTCNLTKKLLPYLS